MQGLARRFLNGVFLPFGSHKIDLAAVHLGIVITCNILIKGAWTYCIINKQDQPVAKECNRKLYYRQKLKKLFSVHPRTGL